METTTTFTNTTNAPYIMSNETKLFICIGIGLFTIPIIFCILISILDLAKHYLGVRNFEDGIIMTLHRRRGMKKVKNPKISTEYLDIEEDCPICMEKLEGKLGHLSCNHYFHEKCLKKWIDTSPNNDCPICRKI